MIFPQPKDVAADILFFVSVVQQWVVMFLESSDKCHPADLDGSHSQNNLSLFIMSLHGK